MLKSILPICCDAVLSKRSPYKNVPGSEKHQVPWAAKVFGTWLSLVGWQFWIGLLMVTPPLLRLLPLEPLIQLS